MVNSIRDQVSDSEWDTRVELAALYRAVHAYGMTDLINNHITASVPDDVDLLLINQFGLRYDEITASSLYKISYEGEIVLEPKDALGLNKTGYIIHGAIHAAREDIRYIIHTHTRSGIAVSAMKCGLLPLSQHAAIVADQVAYHAFEGPAVNTEERIRLVEDLGNKKLMILKNHGLIAAGYTAGEAFLNLHRLEFSCQIQVDALRLGVGDVQQIDQEVLDETRVIMEKEFANDTSLYWHAIIRQLDAIDESYKR